MKSIDKCMTFKEFLQREDANSQEKGLMFSDPPQGRKPSDGQPFKDFLSSLSGAKPAAGAGAGMGTGMNRPMMGAPNMGGGMFMRKKMKKK